MGKPWEASLGECLERGGRGEEGSVAGQEDGGVGPCVWTAGDGEWLCWTQCRVS